MSRKIVVTGATGFVGKRLVRSLRLHSDAELLAVTRSRNVDLPSDVRLFALSNADPFSESLPLQGVDTVIHLAGLAHGQSSDSADYKHVNLTGTLNLARQAASAGVRRFVFLSSIGVNGGESETPFIETDPPRPVGPYAISKWEAEQALFELSAASGLELVVIRPPLVYGADAPGNFARLVAAVRRGVPLPLGAVDNRRTLVGLDNLVDFICLCVRHPLAANQMFLVGDAQSISTAELLRRVGCELNRSARLLPIPVSILETVAGLLGKKAAVRKLCGNLEVDIGKARELLSWTPPVSLDEGLQRCFANKDET